MSIEILREISETPSVFKDRSKLSIEYIPPRLPCREDEYRHLAQFFKPLLRDPSSVSVRVQVRGSVGTGKTVLSRRFAEDLEQEAKRLGINLVHAYVNCRISGSFFNVLKTIIVDSLGYFFPQRGYSSEEALEVLMSILDETQTHLVLVLDEIESLIRREGGDPLYELTRLHEKRAGKPSALSLICVFREPECERFLKLLDRSTLSTLQQNVVYLDKYTPQQLEEILSYRVSEAFVENAVRPETIKLIADIAGAYGDARYAIELLERAGVYADAERSSEVLPDHVRRAQVYIHPSLRRDDLRYLNKHQKLIMLAVARRLKQLESAYITMGDLESYYEVVCEEFGEAPRKHTQLWKYVVELSDLGLLSTKLSGEGMRGKTTLIGLYAPSSLIQRELEEMLGGAEGGSEE